jgi:hypothetical protein
MSLSKISALPKRYLNECDRGANRAKIQGTCHPLYTFEHPGKSRQTPSEIGYLQEPRDIGVHGLAASSRCTSTFFCLLITSYLGTLPASFTGGESDKATHIRRDSRLWCILSPQTRRSIFISFSCLRLRLSPPSQLHGSLETPTPSRPSNLPTRCRPSMLRTRVFPWSPT